jgi:hypothetical protein
MLTMSDEAIRAVGAQAPDDWKLRTEGHTAALPPDAAPLKRVLEMPAIQAMVARYRSADNRARAAQRVYWRIGHLGIWARFVALAIGGVAVLPVGDLAGPSVKPTMIVVQGVALITGCVTTLWIAHRGPFSAWMYARAAAEMARLELLDKVLQSASEARPGEIPLPSLKLEYFRRYQLDVQIASYGDRGEEDARAVGGTDLWRVCNLAFIVLAALGMLHGLGVIGGGRRWGDELAQRAVLALMTLASAALATFLDMWLANLNERSRNATIQANLVRLRDEFLDRVRAAAIGQNEAAVLAFAKLVQDEVRSAYRQWVRMDDIAPRPEVEMLRKLPLVEKRAVVADAATKSAV